MNKFLHSISAAILIICLLLTNADAAACTSAIISADASASGRPMLWKHRDTSTIDNKVEYVPSHDGTFAYVALFNAADRNLDEAWTGMNEVGFAIMNTASYNIKDDNVPQKEMDREGLVMTIALANCRTVDDFATLLDTLPRPMGVEANFGVIDASGNGALFETNNHSYVRFNLNDAPGGVIVRTNYSHSGRQGEGYGHVREANALHLLKPHISNHNITPELLTETLSRSFYNDLLHQDGLSSGNQFLYDQDYIPRFKSTATVVIEGCIPDLDFSLSPSQIISQYIMWTGLGYPPCAEIVPVWCHKSGVADDLRGISGSGTSPMCDKVIRRRNDVFSFKKGSDRNYIQVDKLLNNDGNGYLQTIVPRNLEIYRIFKSKRDNGEIRFDEN